MDNKNSFHRPYLRHLFLAKPPFLQFWELLRLLLYSPWLLWSFCDIQFLVSVLWVLGGRRQHHVRDPWKTDTVELSLRHLLSNWQNVHDWVFAFLQAGNATVLFGEAADGLCHHFLASFRPLPRWRLEVIINILPQSSSDVRRRYIKFSKSFSQLNITVRRQFSNGPLHSWRVYLPLVRHKFSFMFDIPSSLS